MITTPKYHLWNDALHARELARQTSDDWNRGTYIRWTITTAWSVLEMCCRDALEDNNIGNRFKDDIKTAISKKELKQIDWGVGIWQKVLNLKESRRKYTHINIPQEDLWPNIELADNAISIVRDAAKDIYQLAGKDIPKWLDVDSASSWN